ncbi:MAG TPA: hypothetical protein VJ935_08920 [Acidimicrobiia bacterium]|nr:hypothetical protein [Acidimicrobiia bacterium]
MPGQADDSNYGFAYVGEMNNFIAALRLQRPYSRFLGRTALLFAFSAAVHLAVAIARGFDFSGAVSFRKPVTFALSFALMMWAMGWMMDRFPYRPRLAWPLTVVLAGGALIETGLITMQSWRGQASHFNLATDFDAGVFAGMGLTIGAVSLALATLTVWAFREAPADLRLALRAGMVLVVLGLGLGVPLIEMGTRLWETVGSVPNELTVGAAGAAKFPHAIALHGIQVFILAAVVARAVADPYRSHIVRWTVGGYLAIVGWAVIHTNSGRAPTDPTGLESVLLFGGIGALLAAATVWILAIRTPVPSTLQA